VPFVRVVVSARIIKAKATVTAKQKQKQKQKQTQIAKARVNAHANAKAQAKAKRSTYNKAAQATQPISHDKTTESVLAVPACCR